MHAQRLDTLVAPATGSHDGHVTAEPDAAGEDEVLRSAPLGTDSRSGPADALVDGHPGMACVVTVDLEVEEMVAPVMGVWFETPHASRPVDCVVELDPPVPRSS